MRKSSIEVGFVGRDGFTVEVDGRDIRAWEAKHDASFLTADLSYTAICELAGFAAIRTGVWVGSHDEFMAQVVDAVEVDSEPATPTRAGRGAKRSSPSRSAQG